MDLAGLIVLAWNWVAAIVLGASVVWWMAKRIRRLSHSEKIDCHWLCRFRNGSKARTENVRLQLMIESRRVQRLLTVAKSLPFFTAYFIFDYVRLHVHVGLDSDHLMAQRPGIVPLIFGTFVGLVAHLKPECLTGRSFDILIVLFDACVLSIVMYGPEGHFFIARSSVAAYRVAVAAVGQNLWLSIVLNILESAICTLRGRTLGTFDTNLRLDTHSVAGASPIDFETNIVTSEIFVGALAVLVAYMMTQATASEADAILHGKLSRQNEVSVQALLSGLCDSVLRLTSDLQVACPSPKLAAMLLKEAKPRYFEGEDFIRLITLADQERVRCFLGDIDVDGIDVHGDQSAARLLHVSMDDSYGYPLSVHLFHAPFLTLDDEIGHIIGICEASYQDVHRRSFQNTEAWNAERSSIIAEPSSIINPELTSEWSCGISSSEWSAQTEDISAWVNVQTYIIVRVSPALSQLCGQYLEGESIMSWFKRHTEFNMAVQDLFQEDISSSEAVQKRLGKHCLKPPSAREKGMRFVAECILQRSGWEEDWMVRVRFSNVMIAHRATADATTYGRGAQL